MKYWAKSRDCIKQPEVNIEIGLSKSYTAERGERLAKMLGSYTPMGLLDP